VVSLALALACARTSARNGCHSTGWSSAFARLGISRCFGALRRICVHALSSFQRTEADGSWPSVPSRRCLAANSSFRGTFQTYDGRNRDVKRNFDPTTQFPPRVQPSKRRRTKSRRESPLNRAITEQDCRADVRAGHVVHKWPGTTCLTEESSLFGPTAPVNTRPGKRRRFSCKSVQSAPDADHATLALPLPKHHDPTADQVGGPDVVVRLRQPAVVRVETSLFDEPVGLAFRRGQR